MRTSAWLVLTLASSLAWANPICQDADSDPDGDGWGWENGESCVMPGNTDPTHPDCEDADSDPDGDGWGWENGATCVMPSIPVPTDPPPGPPICEDTNSDPDGDGWGWENGESCVMPDDTTPTEPPPEEPPECQEADSDPDGDGWGWENGESCLMPDGGIPTPPPQTPPPQTPPPQTPPPVDGCVVSQHSDWASLDPDCTDIDLQGNAVNGGLRLDETTFASVSANTVITVRNGTIRGDGQTCFTLNRSNVVLEDVRVEDCQYGIRVEASSNRSFTDGEIILRRVEIRGTSNHGIYLGDHNGGAIEEDVTIEQPHIEDIGVDGIAGDVGAGSTVRIEDGSIIAVDQRVKETLNNDPWLICDPARERSQFMGDCVHLQRVRGHVIVDGMTCDHTDMPTKNGFIFQNQGNATLDGHVEVHDSTILMSNACEYDFYLQSPPSRDPKGIQLDRIADIDLTNNTIESAFIGISVNNGWRTCTIEGEVHIGPSAGGLLAGTGGCTIDSVVSSNVDADPDTPTDVDPATEPTPAEPTLNTDVPTPDIGGCSTSGSGLRWAGLLLLALGASRRRSVKG